VLAALIFFLYLAPFSRDLEGWALGELFINYQGGFVRRGLPGELVYQFSLWRDASPTAIFRGIFITLYALNIIVYVAISRAESRIFHRAVLLLAPTFLLFPVYDFPAYARKDVLTTLLLGVHALIAQRVLLGRLSSGTYRKLLVTVVVPLLIAVLLSHDVQIFFISLHFFISWQVLKNERKSPEGFLLSVYVPVALVSLLPIIFHGDRETALAICSSWSPLFAEFPWCEWNSGITALGWDYTQQLRHLREILHDTAAAALFLVGLILSILPYLVFYGVSHFRSVYEGMRPRVLKWLASLSLLTPLALFIVAGWDYGRWIHLVTTGLMVVIFCDPRFDRFEAPLDSILTRARGLEAAPYLLAAGLYIAAWHVPHCCDIRSLQGGLFDAARHSLAAITGASS
jgi:hypothetical protein